MANTAIKINENRTGQTLNEAGKNAFRQNVKEMAQKANEELGAKK